MIPAIRALAGVCLAAAATLSSAQSAAAPDLVSDPNLGASNRASIMGRIGLDYKLGKSVPLDATLVDDTGTAVRLGDLLGKRPVLLVPMFFGCQTACALETDNLLKVLVKEEGQNRLREMGAQAAGLNINDLRREKHLLVGRDFDVIMLSIHPLETPQLARARRMLVEDVFRMGWKRLPQAEQARAMSSIESGFHYVVGKPEDVRRITDSIGFTFYYDAARNQMNHVAATVMLSPQGKISSYITGTEYSTRVLANDVDLAKVNEVGVKGDEFLLGCIHVDPITGKTTLVFTRILTLGCLATVAVLGLSIFVMSRRNPDRPARKLIDNLDSPTDPTQGGDGAA